MKIDEWIDEPVRREKENMDEPQEEFISDEPPSHYPSKEEEGGEHPAEGVLYQGEP